MTYIYLNTYDNGYLYVGSHSWSKEGIDPCYKGSSSIALKYGWVPIKIEILEVVTENKYECEKKWILYYCTKYGVAHININKSYQLDWWSKFKEGIMLNQHANSAECLHSDKVYHKSLSTRIKNGSIDKWSKSNHSKENHDKWLHSEAYLNFRKSSQSQSAIDKRVKSHDYKQSSIKAAKSRDYDNISVKRVSCMNYEESSKKSIETRLGKPINRYDCEVNMITGSVYHCCKQLGHPGWASAVCRKFKQGDRQVIHHGFIFKLLV